jgi:6-phosphogluconolactonase (cycloisomerase 2 family)
MLASGPISYSGHIKTLLTVFVVGCCSIFAFVLAERSAAREPSGQQARLFDAPSFIFDTGIIGEGANPNSLAVGDLDGDGDRDAVVAVILGDPGITVMRNNGNKSFSKTVNYPVASGSSFTAPQDVQLANIDGDGDLDVVGTVGSLSTTKLYVWRNNGDATLANPLIIPTNDYSSKLAVADLNGDGFPDVAIANENYNSTAGFTVHLHNGQTGAAAGFTAPVFTAINAAATDIAAADLNNDGHVDLAVSAGDLRVFLNNGNGTFAPGSSYNPALNAQYKGTTLATADLDNDGDVDLVGSGYYEQGSTGTSQGAYTVLKNNGNGTFGTATVYSLNLFTYLPKDLEAADLNADGFADIFATNPSGRTPEGWVLLMSNGQGGFQAPKLFSTGQWTYSIAAADVDNDGDPDVLTASRDSNALALFENQGNGAFRELTLYQLGTFNDATVSADIDNDGDIDIVTNNETDVSSNQGLVMVSKNNGNGTFAQAVSYPQPRDYFDTKLRDLNGDNFVDLVFGPDGDAPAYHLGYAFNRGDGTFDPTVVLQMNSCGEGTVDAADLDNDGDRDIVFTEEQTCAGGAPARIFIYRNDGAAGFVNLRQIPFFGGPQDLGLADLDRDGKIDIVTIHSNGLAFLRNLGGINFAEPVISGAGGTGHYKFELADLNQDGKLDAGLILNQNFYYAQIGTAMGNGDGTFGFVYFQPGATTAESLRSANDIDIADINGDGFPDLNITNYASNDMSVFITNPDGTLRPQQRFGLGNTPTYSTVGDFDGDQRPDFASVIGINLVYRDYLVVLRNISPAAPPPSPTPSSSPTPPSVAPGFLYVMRDHGMGNQIYGFQVNETTGALTAMGGFPIFTGGVGRGSTQSEYLTVDNVNRRLFVLNDVDPSVSVFSISATGALTALPYSDFLLPVRDWSTIAVHPSGSPLIIGGDGLATPNKVASYNITATSATGAPDSPFSIGTRMFSSVFSRDGNYLYGGGNLESLVGVMSANPANGVLMQIPGSPFNGGSGYPTSYATDTAGRLFLSNYSLGQSSVFTTSDGALTPVSGNPFPNGGLTTVSDGVLHPNGNYYAIVNRSPSSVGVLQISGSGAATTLPPVGSPVSTGGTTGNSLVFNESGTFLFAANADSRNITTFGFNPTTGAIANLNVQPANTLGTSGRINGIGYIRTTQQPPASPTPSPSPTLCGTPATFSNPAAMTIPHAGPAAPYPSNITVSGLTGNVTHIAVTLNNFSHIIPDDVDMLLVGPGGQNAMIMSDAGGSFTVSNITFTLDDAAALHLPDSSSLSNGTFKPVNYVGSGTDTFPAPAPAASGAPALSVFNGTPPNGTWSLYIVDDTAVQAGSLSGGWSIAISTDGCAGSPTPTATATPGAATISGTVTYGNAIGAPNARFVSNVLISAAGSPNVFATTDFPGGNYTLTGLGAGAYTVTPNKNGGAGGAITSFDAGRIAQYAAGVNSLTATQMLVADVSGNGSVSSFDAGQIARYAASLPGAGATGDWAFKPASKTYSSVGSSVSGEDYVGLLMGDVTGNWTNSGARPAGDSASSVDSGKWKVESEEGDAADRSIIVTARPVVAGAEKEIVVPINVEGMTGKGIISYEFDLRYDPAVVQPLESPVDVKGTVSRGLSVVTNATEPGLLRVVVYGAFPVAEDGVLMNLRFSAVGNAGSVSALTLERITFNEGELSAMRVDGRIKLF